MDKKDIKREELKTNFLRQTIIRLDYDVLFQKDMENFIEKIYPYLISKKYKMNSNTLSNINVNLNIDNINNMTKNINTDTENYTSFKNKEENIVIDITKEFITMTIMYQTFQNFKELSEIFNKMIENLKNIRVGFSFNRIGIRKINAWAIRDILNINKYLEETTFNFTKELNEEKSTKFIVKNSIESFVINDYKVNKTVNVAKGIVINNEDKCEEESYQIILDIDIYDDEIKENNIKLIIMNNQLFEIYKDSLKYDFLKKLKTETYEDKEIFKI